MEQQKLSNCLVNTSNYKFK